MYDEPDVVALQALTQRQLLNNLVRLVFHDNEIEAKKVLEAYEQPQKDADVGEDIDEEFRTCSLRFSR